MIPAYGEEMETGTRERLSFTDSPLSDPERDIAAW